MNTSKHEHDWQNVKAANLGSTVVSFCTVCGTKKTSIDTKKPVNVTKHF